MLSPAQIDAVKEVATSAGELRQMLLADVAEAAKRGDVRSVARFSQILERVELICERSRLIREDLVRMGAAPAGSLNEQRPNRAQQQDADSRKLAELAKMRERARSERARLVGDLRRVGIELNPVTGALFTMTDGMILGAAYASERRPNRWFFGLPVDRFDRAVLICETSTSKVFRVFLSAGFLQEHRNSLSLSGGQTKFNVVRRDSTITLLVPEEGHLDVSEYVDAPHVLRD